MRYLFNTYPNILIVSIETLRKIKFLTDVKLNLLDEIKIIFRILYRKLFLKNIIY